MAFHVYPDPQTTPLHLLAGAGPTFTPIVQLTGADPNAGYAKMMFIRVAMVGGVTAPTLLLKAGTGDAVSLTSLTQGIFRTPGMADYVGDGWIFSNEANNVYQIRVGFNADTAETWRLGIKNNDMAAEHDFTWVVADNLADTAQPWIDVSPGSLAYTALINEPQIDQSVQIANKGTAAFTVSGVSPALPAGFVLGALPPSVQPGASAALTVSFNAPAAPPLPSGVVTAVATVAISPADTTALTSAGHNHQLSLTATTQRLEVVLLLDDSGSMSWDPKGNPLPAGSLSSRWGELEDAANQFLNLLAHFGANRGKFGIARFPPGNPGNPATFDIVPPATIPDMAGIAAAQTAVAAIVPTDSTPMGDGIDRVIAPATSYFGTDALSVNADRRWLILMSDGAQNAGTHNPSEYIPPTSTSLADKKIEVFAVAYGVKGYSNVDQGLMTNMAAGSLNGGNKSYVDEAGVTATQLAGALRDTIKAGLTPASSPLDPSGVFRIGQGEVRHQAVLTPYDTRIAFVLSWNTPNAERLRLELQTPNCERITPENAGSGAFKEITFRGGNRYHMYLVDPDFLRNAANPSAPRYGTWTLIIATPVIIGALPPAVGAAAVAPDLENYTYDVIVESRLRMQLTLDRAAYYAGDPIRLSAHLTAAGKPITGASVLLSTTAPAQSVANWLAGLNVPADAFRRAEEMLKGKDSTPLLVKTVAAQLAGLRFEGGQQQINLAMSDPGGIGLYQATFANTSMPEHYTFYVTATGLTEDGISFRREGKLETNVLVRPDPASTHLDIRLSDAGRADVRIVTHDRFGNVLLVDPATNPGFRLVAHGAQFTGPLVSNLDGTYTQPLSYDPKTTPTLGLQFGGHDVIKLQPIPSVPNLHFVDRVVGFDQGAIKDANRHADPSAALGSIAQKPPDRFVSLGAGGALTVAIHEAVMLAAGDNDVTVFVQPDADLRSYRVEAYAVEHHQWVSLGESIGVTQSFSLGRAHLRGTLALRITDTSRRTRGPDLKPLSTPGVSVRGIGVLKTGNDLLWDIDLLPDWLPWHPESGG